MQTQPDFETIKQLWLTSRDDEASDREAEAADEELSRLLPSDLEDEMSEFSAGSPEFERAFREYYEKPGPTVCPRSDVPGGYPAVLPWPPGADGVVEYPAYGIDFRGIPHGQSGKGRKRGELRMDRFWYKRKDGRRRFICRYQLTDRRGKRRSFYPIQGFMARTLAERIHRNADEI